MRSSKSMPSRKVIQRMKAFETKIEGLKKDRQGIIFIITALIFPVLVAFMGLSLDMGFIYDLKRRQQNAANAAAMGGAWEKWRGHDSKITSAAKVDAEMNGFRDKDLTGGNPDVTVTVNPDYTHGGTSGYVEVEIEEIVQTYFMRVLGEDTVTVRSRAVAGLEKYGDGCVIALDDDDSGALTINGGATLQSGCGIMVNSTHDRALTLNGQPGCLLADDYYGIGVTGGIWNPGTPPCVYPDPVPSTPQVDDPLAYMAAYAPSSTICDWTGLSIQTNQGDPPVVISPGVYCGNGGQDSLRISGGGEVQLLAGTYILASGLTITGSATVTGTGVTLYNTSSPTGQWNYVSIGGSGGGGGGCGLIYCPPADEPKVELTAPSGGTYEGMLFWEDASRPVSGQPGHIFAGSALSYFLGAIYAPTAHVAWRGTNGTVDWNMIVANTIEVSGNAVVSGGNFDGSPVSPPTRKVALVE